MIESKSIERSFRFTEDVYEQLKEISERECVSVSNLVRLSVNRFLKEYAGNVDLMEIVTKD